MTWHLTPTTELVFPENSGVESCEELKSPHVEAYLATGRHPRTGQLRLTLHVRLTPGHESEREDLNEILRTATRSWLKVSGLS